MKYDEAMALLDPPQPPPLTFAEKLALLVEAGATVEYAERHTWVMLECHCGWSSRGGVRICFEHADPSLLAAEGEIA